MTTTHTQPVGLAASVDLIKDAIGKHVLDEIGANNETTFTRGNKHVLRFGIDNQHQRFLAVVLSPGDEIRVIPGYRFDGAGDEPDQYRPVHGRGVTGAISALPDMVRDLVALAGTDGPNAW